MPDAGLPAPLGCEDDGEPGTDPTTELTNAVAAITAAVEEAVTNGCLPAEGIPAPLGCEDDGEPGTGGGTGTPLDEVIDTENQCQKIDPALPGACEGDGNPGTDLTQQLTQLAADAQAVVDGAVNAPKPEPSNPQALVTFVGEQLSAVFGLLPVVGEVASPAVTTATGAVAQVLPTAAATPTVPALPDVTSSVAAEVASASADPVAYPTKKVCQVTNGTPPFCTPSATPTEPSTPAPSTVVSSPAVVVSLVPDVPLVPSETAPTFCAGILKKVCK